MARAAINPQIVLRPQDLVVLLRLAQGEGPSPSYAALSAELSITASEAHGAVQRAVAAQLAQKQGRGKVEVLHSALRTFVLQG